MAAPSSEQPRKWRPQADRLDIASPPQQVVQPSASATRSPNVIVGQVSNFESKRSGFQQTNWSTWNFILQCYDSSGAKAGVVPVIMANVVDGQLVNGNEVELYGAFDRKRTFWPDRIVNRSTGAIVTPALPTTGFKLIRVGIRLYIVAFLILFAVVATFIYHQFEFMQQRFRTVPSAPHNSTMPGFPPSAVSQPGTSATPGFPTTPGATPSSHSTLSLTDAQYAQMVDSAKTKLAQAETVCANQRKANPQFNIQQCQSEANSSFAQQMTVINNLRAGRQQ